MVSWLSRMTGWNFMPRAAKYSLAFCSCVVPCAAVRVQVGPRLPDRRIRPQVAHDPLHRQLAVAVAPSTSDIERRGERGDLADEDGGPAPAHGVDVIGWIWSRGSTGWRARRPRGRSRADTYAAATPAQPVGNLGSPPLGFEAGRSSFWVPSPTQT